MSRQSVNSRGLSIDPGPHTFKLLQSPSVHGVHAILLKVNCQHGDHRNGDSHLMGLLLVIGIVVAIMIQYPLHRVQSRRAHILNRLDRIIDFTRIPRAGRVDSDTAIKRFERRCNSASKQALDDQCPKNREKLHG